LNDVTAPEVTLAENSIEASFPRASVGSMDDEVSAEESLARKVSKGALEADASRQNSRSSHGGEDQDGESVQNFFGRRRVAVTASRNAAALRIAARSSSVSGAVRDTSIFQEQSEVLLQAQLRTLGNGSTLRGFRWILDPDGDMKMSWTELENALIGIHFVKSTEELKECLRDSIPSLEVTLLHILPEMGVLVEMFRRWMTDSFGGQEGWFNALNADHTGSVTQESFIKLCSAEGFPVKEEELMELFGCCDVWNKGWITKDLTVFLEADADERDRLITKQKMGQKSEQNRILVSCYNKNSHFPISHRLAIRPWVKHSYEALPAIGKYLTKERETALRCNTLQARVRFIRFLRSFHATEVRAWRRGMDPDGKLAITRSAFKHYCRKIQFEEDINALWNCFDPAGEGVLAIEQFALPAADVLATFRTWAHQSFGSCLGLFETPEAIKRRTTRRADGSFFQKACMSVRDFSSLLWAYGYPPLFGQDGDVLLWYITVSLDFHGGSLITCKDLQWLDGWQPTAWLGAEPDEEAWLKVRSLLEEEYGNLLRAWRKELDTRNANRLTWTQFCEACRRLGFDGNVAGAWRALDQRRVGYISFKEVCPSSAQILVQFQQWAEVKFSSMQEAFRSIDVDGGGSLSFQELKSGCYRYRCQCDPQVLFDALSSNGRSISRKDFLFLAEWVSADEDAATEFKKVLDDLWKEIFTAHQTRESAPRPGSAASWCPPRPVQLDRNRTPARFGSPSATVAIGCIPADFALATPFPISPYSMPCVVRPRSSTNGKTQRRTLRRAISDTTIRAK